MESTGILLRVEQRGVDVPEGLRGYCLQFVCDIMRVCSREWREVDSFERTGEEGRGRYLSQFHLFALGGLADSIERGSAGEGWGSRGMFEIEIAFGHHTALLYIQMNSAESG